MLDRLIRAANKIAIGGHEHPDGDCTGSCMGLYLYIQENYPDKQVDVYLEEIPDSYHFLKDSGKIRHELSGDRDYDLFFCLDCGDKERLGFSRELFDRAAHTLCVDHHISNTNFGEENYVVPDASSTSELVYNLMEKDKITLPVAEALYLGAVMNEPAMQHLVAKFDQNDLNIWSDDCFEMVLDTAGRSDTFYHFVINALGSCYDARGGSRTWNARGMQIKTSRLKDRWIVEMKIPFAAFGVATPQVGEFWGIRLCRERFASKTEYTSSPVVKNGPFSQRNYFAKLYFVPGSSEYDLAVQPERQTFQMGVNHLKLDVKNPKKINGKVRLKTSLYDKDGKCLAVQEIETGVADRISLAAKVADDRAERMAVTVLIDGKTVRWKKTKGMTKKQAKVARNQHLKAARAQGHKVIQPAKYAHLVEFGTKFAPKGQLTTNPYGPKKIRSRDHAPTPAQPFMRPALEQSRKQVLRIISDEVGKALAEMEKK